MAGGLLNVATRPFAPSDRIPEKRANRLTIRFTDPERELLEREAGRRGLTVLNLLREFIDKGLTGAKKPR